MAKLSMTPDEPMKIISLVEALVPGLDLTAIKTILKDTKLSGTLSVDKVIGSTTASLVVEIK
jgi:hypothetical protein